MADILVRIKEGHKMDGEGEVLGTDYTGKSYMFWRSSGHLDVPIDLAVKLELENPQRFEIVNRELAKSLLSVFKVNKELTTSLDKTSPSSEGKDTCSKCDKELTTDDDGCKCDVDKLNETVDDSLIKPVEHALGNEDITLSKLKSMTKDQINDWAAKRDYDVNPIKDNKGPMINKLIKQIEKKTGFKVK